VVEDGQYRLGKVLLLQTFLTIGPVAIVVGL